MNKPNDIPADPFKKSVIGGIALATCLFATPTLAQQTEAEKASQSQRTLTEDEREKRIALCPFPTFRKELNIAGYSGYTIKLDSYDVLAVASRKATAERFGTDNTVTVFDPLPYGGIGFRDYCNSVVLYSMTSAIGATNWKVGLRLMPGLDVETDYPSAFSFIAEARQIDRIPAGFYWANPSTMDEYVYPLLKQLKADSRIKQDGYAFFAEDKLFVPITMSAFGS